MPDNKVNVFGAYAFQGEVEGSYKGSDFWQLDILSPGKKLVQLDCPRNNADIQTASKFFTTYEELQDHIDLKTGKVDTVGLSERLQVVAHRSDFNSEYSHSPKVTVYEVTDKISVASARVTDNVAFGKGGAQQYFSHLGNDALIKNPETGEGFLKKVDEIDSYNTKPRLLVYEDLRNAVSDRQVQDVMEKHHGAYLDALVLSGDEKALEVRNAMQERQDFSEPARDIVKKTILNS